MKMKILTIIGARPQFIKASVVSNKFKERNIDEVIVHTGQHFDKDMSDIFFDEMNIPAPKHRLNLGGLSHGAMTGRMIEEIEQIIISECATHVLVYGDTNSTLAAAIASSKLDVKLIHVESGLRSFNNNMPEEINRILTDRLSDILFCPTEASLLNLKSESFDAMDKKIVVNGDVMLDAILFFSEFATKPEKLITSEHPSLLVTIHRAETTDNKEILVRVVDALNILSKEFNVWLPLHPRTKGKLKEYGVHLEFQTLEPASYLEMIWMLNHCAMVMTDSGGLQKEAYFMSKPCVTVREQTEWIELVELGVNKLVSPKDGDIVSSVDSMRKLTIDVNGMIYGDGNSCDIIADVLQAECN